MRCRLHVAAGWKDVAVTERREFFRVELLYKTEPPKFAFSAIKIPVVVGVARNKPAAADAVASLDSFDYVNGKRDPRDPRFSSEFVGQIELR